MTAVRPVGVDPSRYYDPNVARVAGVGTAYVGATSLAAVAAAGGIATGQPVQIPGVTTAGGGAQQEGASGEQSLGGAVGGGVIDGVSRPISAIIDTVTDPKKLLIAGGLVALSIAFPIVGTALLAYGLYSGGKDMLNGGRDIFQGITNGNMSQVRTGVANLVQGAIEAGLSAFGFKAKIKADFKAVNKHLGIEDGTTMVGTKVINSADDITVVDALRLQARQVVNGSKAAWKNAGEFNLKDTNLHEKATGLFKSSKKKAVEIADEGSFQARVSADPKIKDIDKNIRQAKTDGLDTSHLESARKARVEEIKTAETTRAEGYKTNKESLKQTKDELATANEQVTASQQSLQAATDRTIATRDAAKTAEEASKQASKAADEAAQAMSTAQKEAQIAAAQYRTICKNLKVSPQSLNGKNAEQIREMATQLRQQADNMPKVSQGRGKPRTVSAEAQKLHEQADALDTVARRRQDFADKTAAHTTAKDAVQPKADAAAAAKAEYETAFWAEDKAKQAAGWSKVDVARLESRAQNLRNFSSPQAEIATIRSQVQEQQKYLKNNPDAANAEAVKAQIKAGEDRIAELQGASSFGKAYHTARVFGEKNPGYYYGLGSVMTAHNPFAGSYEEKRRRGQV